MLREIGGRSSASKESIPDEPYDPRIKIFEDFKEKTEKVKFLDLDLVDQVLFPQMSIDVLWDLDLDSIGGMQFVSRPKFINLFNSTIMNLEDLLVFETTGEVAHFTKFIIIRVLDRSLWLKWRYLIHADEIFQLTILSLEGEDVTKGFQGPRKHGKKKGEVSLYEKFHTQRGGQKTRIDPIIPETVQKTYYIISNKFM
jgi:hypothetical protein